MDVSMRQDTGLRKAVGFLLGFPGVMIRSCVFPGVFKDVKNETERRTRAPLIYERGCTYGYIRIN